MLLAVKDLHIHYETDFGVAKAVNGLSFSLAQGETLGLVGETGAGKTTTALGIMKLVQSPPGRIVSGDIVFEGQSLLKASEAEMRKVRGERIAMIFQDPMTSLNPVQTVGVQIAEVIKLHNRKLKKKEVEQRVRQMLEIVGIPSDRLNEYPHQFSGGMKQRVIIAIALACNPVLLIADEPTTALDVTIQAQVLKLMADLKKDFNTSMIMISHDLGVVAEVCDKVAIIYAGEIVEYGTMDDIFSNPTHPYTLGLFNSIPDISRKTSRLEPIKGLMPDPYDLPKGCSFHPRCSRASDDTCAQGSIGMEQLSPSHFVKCCRITEGG